MAVDVARRKFILAFGGTAGAWTLAWPLAAGAQSSNQMRRMGLLVGYSEKDAEAQAQIAALRGTLDKLGWSATRNIRR